MRIDNTARDAGGSTQVIDREPARRDRWSWLLVLLVLVGAAAVGALLAVRANSRDRPAPPAPDFTAAPAQKRVRPTTTAAVSFAPAPAAVTVPDVRGEKLPTARKALRDAGLVTDEQKVSSELRKNTVVAQVPAPGTAAKSGDHVLLRIAFGAKKEAGPGGHDKGHSDRRGGPKPRHKGETTWESE
jgi:hypothetical protein